MPVLTPDQRAKRKQQQKDRQAAKKKGKKALLAHYEESGYHQAKAALNEKIGDARRAQKATKAALTDAIMDGGDIGAAEEAVIAAATKLATLQATKRRRYGVASATLSEVPK